MKKIFTFLMTSLLAMTLLGTVVVNATSVRPSRLEDYADLLTEPEEQALRELLDKKSEELQMDLVVVTTDSTGGKSSEAYADDFFDYNGYGMGENYDGVLLLINMEYREWHISTTGYGMTAIQDSEVDSVAEEMVEYLSVGYYDSAIREFIKEVEDEVADAHDAEVLDVGEIIFRMIIAAVIGMGLAFIPVSVMKGKMNNVQMKNEAADYMKRDQIQMKEQRDMFLYSTISRTRKPQENTSRSGGGHVGSSGRSHGGGGRRF